ncbi:MAG: hypothetical protein A4E60_02876 [Syntrophorhabdus sp. PtaB.Bin047]|nr:MAG: hypothetical protein A4E60_02876 [Syntrophorhabdus sp. PtaB.Bin047]
MKTTSRIASKRVWTTSSMEMRTKSVVSREILYSMPSGMDFFNSSMVFRTAAETSSPLTPGCW